MQFKIFENSSQRYDDFLMKEQLNVEDISYYQKKFGSYLGKIIKEINKARIVQILSEKTQALHVDFEELKVPEQDLKSDMKLKWVEHRGWLELKTVLPRGEEIIKYGISITGEIFKIRVQTTREVTYHVELDLYKPVVQYHWIPLSDSVVKIRLDKADRQEWGKLTKKKTHSVVSDLDVDWPDFDQDENFEDQIEYQGVHPDGLEEEYDMINELDIEYDSDPEN